MATKKDYSAIRENVEGYLKTIPMDDFICYKEALEDKIDLQLEERITDLIMLAARFKSGDAGKTAYNDAETILSEIADIHDSVGMLQEYITEKFNGKGRYGNMRVIEGGALRREDDVTKEEEAAPKTGTKGK